MLKRYLMAVLSLGLVACGPGEKTLDAPPLASVQQKVMQTVGPLQLARAQHCSARLPDGKVLFVGGWINNNTAVTNTTEMYDPVMKTLSFRAPMNVARRGHSCLLLRDGSLLVLGGVGDSLTLDSVERYDSSTNTWTLLAPMPLRNYGMGLTQLDDGRILLAGGSSTNWACFLFDPSSNTWTSTGSLNVGRFGLNPIKLPDNRVLAVGGSSSNNYRVLEVYTPATGSWSLLAPMINVSINPAVILLPDGRVFVGNTEDGTGGTRAEVYDVSKNTWTVLPPANSAHFYSARVGLVDGQPVVVGGSTKWSGEPLIIERFDFAQQRWTTLGQLSVIRYEYTLDVLTDGSLLIVGGVNWSTRQSYATMDLLTIDATPRPDTAPLSYNAANTNSAQQNTTNRAFTLKAGDLLEVGTCNVTGSSATGDTYLRLFSRGAQVAYNDDSCGGTASFIQYTAPDTGTYELRAGCYSALSCSGTVTFRITPAKQLRGTLDVADERWIAGWSQNENEPTAATFVDLYFDGPAGSSQMTSRVLANLYRADLCSPLGSCSHGFSMEVPESLCDGQWHSVYAYGVDANDGRLTHLNDSPKSFVCHVARGTLDEARSEAISGWSQDLDAPDVSNQVELYFDGQAGSSAQLLRVPANIYREDLCSGISSCTHGFSVPPPSQFCDGQPHTVYAYGVDTETGNIRQLNGSPKSFTCL